MEQTKLGSVEYFENYIEKALLKDDKVSHEGLYRVTYALFDLVMEDSFSINKKDMLLKLENLKEATKRIEDRLTSRWEDVLQ